MQRRVPHTRTDAIEPALPSDARPSSMYRNVRSKRGACSAESRGVATVCAHMRELPEEIACISFDLQCVSRHKRRLWVFIARVVFIIPSIPPGSLRTPHLLSLRVLPLATPQPA